MVVRAALKLFAFGKRLCGEALLLDSIRFSIIRAFLIEEQRIVAMVMKSKKQTGPTETAAATTTSQTAGAKSK